MHELYFSMKRSAIPTSNATHLFYDLHYLNFVFVLTLCLLISIIALQDRMRNSQNINF